MGNIPNEAVCMPDADKLRCFVTLCGLDAGARVLDVGCGEGVLTPFLLDRTPKRVLGVDLDSAKIEEARGRYPDSPAEFLCGDVMTLEETGFDCAILYNCFTEFENRGSLTRQMNHLLGSGGRLMICHSQGRHQVNLGNSGVPVAVPLPAAKTLATTLSQYFEIDMLADAPGIYLVSGIRREA